MKTIRLINSGAATGPWNMAVDECLSLKMAEENFAADGFIRFYRWDPPTLSFGYNQNINRLLDVDKAIQNGYGVVKRMSGGKMVFHANEWTFSLGFHLEDLRKNGGKTFLEMFMAAINPLLQALIDVGVPARFSDNREIKLVQGNSIHCYAAAAGHSIFAGNEKLIGAAGIVKGSQMTIHGSIPISVEYPVSDIFLRPTRIEDGVNMTCLKKFLDHSAIENLPTVVAQKYSELFLCGVINSELSAEENVTAKTLSNEKYAYLNWKEIISEK